MADIAPTCTTCRHYRPGMNSESTCRFVPDGHPPGWHDPETGRFYPHEMETMHARGRRGHCGAEARNWQKRPPWWRRAAAWIWRPCP